MNDKILFDWNDLAFASKKPLKSLNATFIMALREMSPQRLAEMIKTYLTSGHVIIGISKEPYVLGFEDQPQFRMLALQAAEHLAKKVVAARSPHRLVILHYSQRDLVHLADQINSKRFVAVNGSYKLAFQNLPVYYRLAAAGIPIDHVSPFMSDAESMDYAKLHAPILELPKSGAVIQDETAMKLAIDIAKQSYDYCTQVGAVLAKKSGKSYTFINAAYNRVIPYQGYNLHHGSQREIYLSPPADINHHDTIHAEMGILLDAIEQSVDLKGTTLFSDLMPCPACARVLSGTAIEEFVYMHDYGDGYAVKLFELSGKKVRRYVVKEAL